MNPFLIILILIGFILLWFLLAFAFKPIGKIVEHLYEDVKSVMNDESEDKND